MRIIEIQKLATGGHRNQILSWKQEIPDGWAVIPDDIETTNYPFGDIDVDSIDGVMTVIRWTPAEMPEPEPPPAPEPEPTLDERVTSLETEKANQTDVDELNEALNMILTGYTGEEAADETGA